MPSLKKTAFNREIPKVLGGMAGGKAEAVSMQRMKEAQKQLESKKATDAALSANDMFKTGREMNPWEMPAHLRSCLFSAKTNLVLGATAPSSATDPTVSLTADYLSVEGVGFSSLSETVSVFDTGAIAATTWYAVWAMCGSRGEGLVFRLSTSFTAPTMATGTVLSRRVGAVRSNAAGNGFYRFVQAGDWTWWNEDITATPFLVLNVTTSATSFTDVDCTAVAPPPARALKLRFYAYNVSGANAYLGLRGNNQGNLVYADGYKTGQAIGGSSGSLNPQAQGLVETPCDSGQIVEYRGDASTTDVKLAVAAYQDVV